MKVVFLDFDGVLLPLPVDGSYDPNLAPSTEAVNNLNILIQLSEAAVVVTSAWRVGRSVQELQSLLSSWGYKFGVYDKIRTDSDEDRGINISNWIFAQDAPNLVKFAVIDDDATDLAKLAKYLVMPKPDVGLQFHDVKEVLRILGEQ